MAVVKRKSFCRICSAGCGLNVSVGIGHPIEVRGDPEHPMTRGYACFKGISTARAHTDPKRLLHPLRRMKDGTFAAVPIAEAIDDIAARLSTIRNEFGPDAIATYHGSGTIQTSAATRILPAFRQAVGTTQDYFNLTIDQSSKFVAAERMGAWEAGKDSLGDSDVAMLIGCNPLVAHLTGGFLGTDPTRRLKMAIARGLKLVVIDPRRTETAHHATVFLQPYPGEDAAILAGLIRLVLGEGRQDEAFCADYVAPGHLERLRAAVEPFTVHYVCDRAGVPRDALRDAARLFADELLQIVTA